MENLSKSRISSSSTSTSPASSFMSSRSCDSIYRSQPKPKINPKLPVAENTARILERAPNAQPNKNGINTKKEVINERYVNNSIDFPAIPVILSYSNQLGIFEMHTVWIFWWIMFNLASMPLERQCIDLMSNNLTAINRIN